MTRASGPFDVTLTPQASDAADQAAGVARLAIAKQFHGDLVGTSRGVMVSAMTAVKGSAVYSAIERVEGTLGGRAGAFALQHTGVMDRGVGALRITVVPDSATGDLAGLTGTMDIQIDDGKHRYTFDYTLPSAG